MKHLLVLGLGVALAFGTVTAVASDDKKHDDKKHADKKHDKKDEKKKKDH